MKKIFKYILILFVVAVISAGISILISKNKGAGTPDELADNSLVNRFEEPVEHSAFAGDRPVKLTTDEASFAVIAPGTNLRYYHARSGDIKEIDLVKPGTATVVATIKPNALNIVWSSDGNQIIAQYATGYTSADLKTKTTKSIAKNIFFPAFSQNADNVAYVYFNDTTGEGNISIADAQFKNFKNLLKTRLKEWKLQWTDQRNLSLIADVASTKSNTLFVLDTDKGSFLQLLENQKDLQINWSPDGVTLLFSRRGRLGVELGLLTMVERAPHMLGIYTDAQKCAWMPDNTAIYCAVPEKKGESDDMFVKITVASANEKPQKLFAAADTGFADAQDMMYATSASSLIYKNLKDGRLYLLSLSK